MTDSRRTQLEFEVDATGVRTGTSEITREVGTMAQSVARVSAPAADAIEGIGRGASRSASQMDAAQRSFISSIQRTSVALDAGGRSTAAYFELLSQQRGFDPNVVAPYIAQLRELEQTQARQAAASAEADAARVRAAEVTRTQAAAERDLAQAQAGREQFLNGLREQIQLYGRSTDDVLRYRAAQAGIAADAAPLILQLQNVRAAHEQAAQAAREQVQAERAAAQAQAGRDSFLAALEQQSGAIGRTRTQLLELQAAQLGVSTQAAPYIRSINEAEAAQVRSTEAARAQATAERELAQAQAGREQFLNSLREQTRLYGRSADDVLRYRAAQAGVAAEAAPLILQLQNIRAAHEQTAQAARDQAAAERAAAQVQSGQTSFIASLEQQANAIGRTRTQLLEMQAAQMGVSTQAAPFIARLREAETGFDRTGMSARATAAALRGVPAQVTDIVTSLQGGQAPLTVFLQQGGQLRDMFGSAGGAARALGSYVLGLINPYTLAAAAAAAIGVAYYQGSQESKAFRQEIALSGNAAGTTSGQLSDMARNISKAVGTQAGAAEALAAMVGTGKVAAADLQAYSTVAINGQRALGQSVQDTAKNFGDLAKTPLASLEKLNEQYHFLTGATYAQVKALLDQGRAVEAGRLAQKTYADAFDGIATKVDANLGTIERGWKHVTDGAKSAWDAMLGVGREDSLETQLAKVRKSIENAQKPFSAGFDGNAEDRANLKVNQAKELSLEHQIAKEKTVAGLQADQQRFNAADLEWTKSKTQNLTRAQQLEYDLATTRQKGLDAGISDVEINSELAKVRLKYNDIYNDGIDSQIAGLKRRQAVEDIIAKRAIDQITANRTAGSITEDDAINQTASKELSDMAAKRDGMEKELALIRKKQNSLTAQKDKQGEIDALDETVTNRKEQRKNDLFAAEQRRTRQALNNTADLFDGATAERDGLIQQIRTQHDYNDQIGATATEVQALTQARLEERAARKDTEANTADSQDLNGERARIIREQAAALRDLAAAQQAGFVKQRDPWIGLIASVRRYGDEAADVGTLIGTAMSNGLKSTEDAFVSLVTTGKASFKELASSIMADLARIAIKRAVAGFVDMAIGAYTGYNSGGATTALAGARASGGPVTGGLPYLVGEKGPEIIVPGSNSTVIPNHALGGGSGVTINMETNISGGNATSQTSGDSGSARAMADALNAKWKAFLMNEIRPGGIVYNFQNGRG